jgi:protoporphyrinogen/coproporphyrinogen III oxidase
MSASRYDLVVVGGGIAGLAAAWEAVRRQPSAQVLVVEATSRFGGKLHTDLFGGRPVDRGADAFLVRTPDALELVHELGLDDELVHPAQRSALLYLDGVLHRLPEGLVLGVPTDLDALEASGILSRRGLERLRADLGEHPDSAPTGEDPVPSGRTPAAGGRSDDSWSGDGGSGDGGSDSQSGDDTTDTSVGALVRSRLGDEAFERLVAPLLAGINAGDPDQLSLAAGAPQLAAAGRHSSLVRGARAQRSGGDPEAPVFASLQGGTGRLVEALLEALGDAGVVLRAGTRIQRMAPGNDARFRLVFSDPGGEVVTDRVVLATPSGTSAALLDSLADRQADEDGDRSDGDRCDGDEPPRTSQGRPREDRDPPQTARRVAAVLSDIAYASVAVVTLAYPRDAVSHPMDASGMLVPDGQGLLCTACSFGSAKWPHWSAPDVVVLRASVGRFHDDRFLAYDDRRLVRHLHNELAPALGLGAEPLEASVTRWREALPQYRPGHLDRLDLIETALARDLPGLRLAGAGTRGIGIPACIRSGRTAAAQVLAAT